MNWFAFSWLRMSSGTAWSAAVAQHASTSQWASGVPRIPITLLQNSKAEGYSVTDRQKSQSLQGRPLQCRPGSLCAHRVHYIFVLLEMCHYTVEAPWKCSQCHASDRSNRASFPWTQMTISLSPQNWRNKFLCWRGRRYFKMVSALLKGPLTLSEVLVKWPDYPYNSTEGTIPVACNWSSFSNKPTTWSNVGYAHDCS